jgi:hypothetical protein
MRARLLYLAFHLDPQPILIIAGVLWIAWGWTIASDSMLTINPYYMFIGRHLSEPVVGHAAMLLGALKLLSVALDRVRWMQAAALLGAAAWLGLAMGMWASGFPGTAVPMNTVHGIASLWAFTLLGVRHHVH